MRNFGRELRVWEIDRIQDFYPVNLRQIGVKPSLAASFLNNLDPKEDELKTTHSEVSRDHGKCGKVIKYIS